MLTVDLEMSIQTNFSQEPELRIFDQRAEFFEQVP
ncbi:hypothetical protein Desti_1216 [Desulfomonile tiedjei DSM 6799]|uniref:Uncharacterized protein n=1 Tax=Desulfomonile tiedjei (strain ATCC 49306 / DSM 6799 / DCB-1) TaxID=706587 RepID=I4C2Y8_DESTA|nr:hypothetical protein Desti_1216 [Desulfomonile tiedjei DSM 6799]